MKHVKLFEKYNKRELIFLIGPPGSGKSTYIKKLNEDRSYLVINRDDIVYEVAKENNLTYKDMFVRPDLVMDEDRNYVKIEPTFYDKNDKTYVNGYEQYGEIVEVPEEHYIRKNTKYQFKKILDLNDKIAEIFDEKLKSFLKSDKSIIIDMTNINKKYRNDILKKVKNKNNFIIKAVVFNNGGKGFYQEILDINKKRDKKLRKLNKEKDLPDFVIKSFIDKYEKPTLEEGFDEINFFNFLNKNL